MTDDKDSKKKKKERESEYVDVTLGGSGES